MSHNIHENIRLHEKIAFQYTGRHPEIYNPIEQQRLLECLQMAVSAIETDSSVPTVLDYGCGDGNLTHHVLSLGVNVVAADVTPSFVDIVVGKYSGTGKVTGMILNGTDMRELESGSVDMIAVYSVLHHIPDYLAAIADMARVLKPGGILFIDHERGPAYWNPSKELTEFRQLTHVGTSVSDYASRLLRPSWWVKRFRKTLNPRYQEEGDIHVWPDDHIEFHRIQQVLADTSMSVIKEIDYLPYEPHYRMDLYDKYKSVCSTMRCLIARKK